MEFTINEQQKQTVTGVRNQLWQKLQSMHPDSAYAITYADLENLVERLERVVEPLDEEENKRTQERINYYSSFGKGFCLNSTWSMWQDPSGTENYIRMSSLHPYAEGTVIEYNASNGYGNTYRVAIEGHRWIDVWRACDQLIQMSGDDHHIFIERLHATDDGVLVLSTGS